MSNLSGFYLNASLEIKQKLLGSIFPANLHFRDASYRTTPLNPATALILQRDRLLENKKTGQILFEESLSGHLQMTGQLSNHFIEGMRQIYELKPFIDVEVIGAGRSNMAVRREVLASTGSKERKTARYFTSFYVIEPN